MALNLIMLGPPGAGKGTQAEQVARARRIPRISTGDILREAVHNGTDIGKRAQAIMARGELVGDDVMIGIVRERLDKGDVNDGFVLDGFPRTVAQAKALDAIMTGRDPLVVVDITVPEAELVRRLSVRMVCEACGTTAGAPAATGARGDAAASGSAACVRCGGKLVQRDDDGAEVVRERLKVYSRRTRPLVEFYEKRPTFRSVNGAQPPDRVAADVVSAIESASTGGVRA